MASETLGYDRWLHTNTAKTRTHSLLRQGQMLYDLLPNVRVERRLADGPAGAKVSARTRCSAPRSRQSVPHYFGVPPRDAD